MALNISHAFRQAVGLGIIAGMRTFMAPAVVSHLYSRHPSQRLKDTQVKFIQSITTSKVFKVLAAGELVGDKLPTAPNRTSAPGLIGRVLSGAFAGAVVYKAEGNNPVTGGIVGGAAALASTFGCFFLRTEIDKKKVVPDAIIGACEDVLAITIGSNIAKSKLV